ncbi:MAG TPA: hypothetical protein VHR72_13625 [Gemmataceae bacterium]|jgi:hypothetical protein|nr:hypothetical protein [Gemmataceae bacterium]
MPERRLHILQILIRHSDEDVVRFLVYPHATWRSATGERCLALPTKTSVEDVPEPFERGTSLEPLVDALLQHKLGLSAHAYAVEQELDPVIVRMISPTHGVMTDYSVFPLDVWVDPAVREEVRRRLSGLWLSADEALARTDLGPTAQAVFTEVLRREGTLEEVYATNPSAEHAPEAPRRLLRNVTDIPTMDALAKRWFALNCAGVRVLDKASLDQILDVGERSFNLRVADPYLRYQQQGLGFAWSFFTHKDPQDTHVHGAPIVEIYGVLEGQLEIWWKPYFHRGTSAWNHRVLAAGDWAEVDSLQCHLVHWLTEGKGVVFKAGPGPLADVGRLGVKGKTPCEGCPCKKPVEVVELENRRRTAQG